MRHAVSECYISPYFVVRVDSMHACMDLPLANVVVSMHLQLLVRIYQLNTRAQAEAWKVSEYEEVIKARFERLEQELVLHGGATKTGNANTVECLTVRIPQVAPCEVHEHVTWAEVAKTRGPATAGVVFRQETFCQEDMQHAKSHEMYGGSPSGI